MSVYGGYAVSFDNPNSTWARAGAMVTSGSTVLDIGCSAGQMAEVLKRTLACTVDGVEIDERDAAIAAQRCRQVFVGDLSAVVSEIEGRYDHVLLLDVLEHFADPVEALRMVSNLLAPGGSAIVSVPNMAHASVRLLLLQGHFPPADDGLLDRTHLRFFDEATLLETIAASPLEVETLDRIVIDLPPDIVSQALAVVGLQPTPEFSDIIRSREASTYQFVARLRHRRGGDVEHQPRAEYFAPLDQYWSDLRAAQARAVAAEAALAAREAVSIRLPSRLRWVKRLHARR